MKVIDLKKKIEELQKAQRVEYLETILAFKDYEKMETYDLRTIANVIESYKATLNKSEIIKDKFRLYSKIYFNDTDDEIETLLNAMDADNEAQFIQRLENEFDVILTSKSPKERLETIEEIKDLFKDAFVLTDKNFQPAMNRLHITDNWEKALSGMQVEKMAKDLQYSFCPADLKDLATIHKTTTKRIVKKRIEDLLTYCNFHYESSMLHDGNYEQFL